jgi:hypothetical protein
MFMPKQPLSVTLDQSNLLWLRGRAAGRKKRSLSDALDEILTEARLGGKGGDPVRSVVGTVDIAGDDPALERADAAIRSLVDQSLSRPVVAREGAVPYSRGSARKSPLRKRRG